MVAKVEISTLPPHLAESILQSTGQIPSKWKTYSRVWDTISIIPLSEAKWCINKIRHDLDLISRQINPKPNSNNHH